MSRDFEALYSRPLPASRSGPLFSAFSYPTKISPESIAVFIASHTKPGDVVLDVFGGSGTTGLAVMLCADPPPEVIELARRLEAPVQWGPRSAIIYELSTLGAFIAQTLVNSPDARQFLIEAEALITRCEARIGHVYTARGPNGEPGIIRHAIWTAIIKCPHCRADTRFWDAAVRFKPLRIEETFDCATCGKKSFIKGSPRSEETFNDPLLHARCSRRRREIAVVYGCSGKKNWMRPGTSEDAAIAASTIDLEVPLCAPIAAIPWGDLYRAGYHSGITYAHHFYTPRNWLVMAIIWDEIEKSPEPLRDALRLLALSYNAMHATLMTRVVVKKRQKDFVLTGAQTGVLYVSSLSVEKNLLKGLRHKAKTFYRAFEILNGRDSVQVVNATSRRLDLPDHSVDYVFTDPPFGGFIPYAELSFLNEIWLGRLTDRSEEIIVSNAQGKTVEAYGSLLADVFTEVSRVLKDEGRATVVFHSAKAKVWRTLQEAFLTSGLRVEQSSVLDKLQDSFKQINSKVAAKGDALLLLTKSKAVNSPRGNTMDTDAIMSELVAIAAKAQDEKESTPERLYSRFTALCMERGQPISVDAAGFYRRAQELLGNQVGVGVTNQTTSPSLPRPLEHKKRLGQYFTGVKLASLLARLSFVENAISVIDPMAGNGDILEAVAHLAPEAELYGIELDASHAEATKRRLSERAQIITGNAFTWNTIARLRRSAFDLVITNPPYVRYQSFSAEAGGDLPNADTMRSGLIDIISRLPGLDNGDRKILVALAQSYSGLSDLAVPSWILCAMLVRPGGYLSMVAPESWLKRDYADCIHYLLLKLFRPRWVVENEARDWFEDAQIKTTLVVAERLTGPRDLSVSLSDESFIQVALGRKARDSRGPAGGLFPDRLDPDSALRELLSSAQTGNPPPVDGVSIIKSSLSAKMDDLLATTRTSLRLRDLEPWIGSRRDLAGARSAKLPQPLVNLLDGEAARRVRSLPENGVCVGQGLRTGANNFFYCTLPEVGDELSLILPSRALGGPTLVPNDAVLPVLRKQAEVPEGFTLDLNVLRSRVLVLDSFSPPEASAPERGRRLMPEGLRHLVLTAQKTKSGRANKQKLIPELSAVMTNLSAPSAKNSWTARHWFMLPPLAHRHRPDLFVARINNLHPRTMFNPGRAAVIDANFSTLWIESGNSAPTALAVLALMNSTWCVAAMELLGAVMGGGALKLEAAHIRKLPVPDLSNEGWQQLETLGETLTTNRSPVETIDEIDRVVALALFGFDKARHSLAVLREIKASCLQARKTK